MSTPALDSHATQQEAAAPPAPPGGLAGGPLVVLLGSPVVCFHFAIYGVSQIVAHYKKYYICNPNPGNGPENRQGKHRGLPGCCYLGCDTIHSFCDEQLN